MGSESTRKYVRLADCTLDGKIPYGIVQPGKHVRRGVPIVRVNNINNGELDIANPLKVDPIVEAKYERTRLEGGEVLLTLVGSTGQSLVAPPELAGWNVARAIAVIRVKKDVGAEWVNICLHSREAQHFLEVRANTTVQKTLNLKDVRDIPILIPRSETKDFIESCWVSLSRKIELNRRMNETLEAMAQALFKSWFVDFDPVIDKALAAGNPIPEPLQRRASARQALGDRRKPLPDSIAQHVPDRFVFNEDLGWIPEGWGVQSLDEIARYQNGLALQKFRPEDENDFLPVVKIAQLRQGYADGDEKASPEIKSECIIDDGDVIFSWSGTLMVRIWCGGKAALNQHLFKVTSDRYPKPFYYHWTLHHLREFQRIASDKAVTMGHIKREHLKQALCAVPSAELIEVHSRASSNLIQRQIDCSLEGRTLAKLRDTLLPKLLSGEFRVPDAEKQVEEAL